MCRRGRKTAPRRPPTGSHSATNHWRAKDRHDQQLTDGGSGEQQHEPLMSTEARDVPIRKRLHQHRVGEVGKPYASARRSRSRAELSLTLDRELISVVPRRGSVAGAPLSRWSGALLRAACRRIAAARYIRGSPPRRAPRGIDDVRNSASGSGVRGVQAGSVAARSAPRRAADRHARACSGRRRPRCDRRYAARRAPALSSTPALRVWAKLEAAQPRRQHQGPAAARMHRRTRCDDGEIGPGHHGRRVDVGEHRRRARPGLPVPRPRGSSASSTPRARARTSATLRALGADVRVVTEPDPLTRRPARRPARAGPGPRGDDTRARSGPTSTPTSRIRPRTPTGTMREIDEALDGRHRLPLRRDEHHGHPARLRRLPPRARPRDPDRRGRRRRQRALRRQRGPRAAARLRRRRRDPTSRDRPGSTSSCGSPTSIASSAAAAWSQREAILAGGSSGGVALGARDLLAPDHAAGKPLRDHPPRRRRRLSRDRLRRRLGRRGARPRGRASSPRCVAEGRARV